MALRLIQTLSEQGHQVKVYIDYTWQEYRAVLRGAPKSTYHTNDREDALDTAKCMLAEAITREPKNEHRT